MPNLNLQQISSAMPCRVATWQTSQVIKGFTKKHKTPFPFSLVFIFNRVVNEDKLIQRLVMGKATGVVVSSNHHLELDKFAKAGIGVLEVKRIKQAYFQMAKLYRRQFPIPIVQVIGSSGKTTTKEMIGSILKQEYSTLVSALNLNGLTGVPYNLSKLEKNHEAAVLEVGMKAFGTMDLLSQMTQPQIGVVTGIHRAHLTRLGSIENIIKAKAEMIKHLSPDGALIINGDDPNCAEFLKIIKYPGKIITFGFNRGNTIRAKRIRYKNFQCFFKVKGKGFKFNCMLNTFGSYNISNALAAIAVGIELRVPHHKIQQGLAEFSPVKGRMQVISCTNDITLIHDNFNANPDSTKLLLSQIPHLPRKRPVTLVLGDMESPETNEAYAKMVHYQIGKKTGSLAIDKLIAIGKWAEEYCQGAKAMGIPTKKLYYYKQVDDAMKDMPHLVQPSSIVIFKASVTYIDQKPLIRLFSRNT
ncbi:UDP-N-acetylmuramoyl-tripeptide--D-alanyl-D-alanine ligase [Bacillus sp. DTU_2020_1000418_1_SI_GHA_SEK_038]|uniref:UDP-N-acetylmuramoyl-tripeptide--D-alanyl-D- alanine ligase n=1 Tax=Bacillus sp. DTU_2020_1000418_1_SI_GHA_SEK_038 TaxID=3077585 RepID=UPI0028E452D0|nr:UDP-N-acetylmuramoyl-tripeptide--D-alanyl-D-alanine ligase [Bacillus sp. DTU_2020_1000418_1_SI_GHA_SEK_038]WNS75407.1 UDP-N-acetylmuramoyl-tripeptide--D-alanyl-D-alanine ligase [Bacillus sp. DTU_2020_1000418_1_SI_GHA_SEK_038]